MCCVTGEYEINVLWNEIQLARCPVTGHAEAVVSPSTKSKQPPPLPHRDKIILTGNGLTKARVNRQAEFVIDATDAAPGNSPSIYGDSSDECMKTVFIPLRIAIDNVGYTHDSMRMFTTRFLYC